MGIGDIIGFISFAIGMIVAYPALLIMLNILFTGSTTKAAYRLNRGMKLPFFIGLIVAVVGYGLIFAMLSVGSVLQLMGVILYLILAFWGTIGIAGLARVFGEHLADMDDKSPSILRKLLNGGGVLTLSFAFPLIGWFVLIPLGTIIGLGAATLSIFTKIQEDDDATVVVSS